MVKKIPWTTKQPEYRKLMYQVALKEKMRAWSCFNPVSPKSIICRNFLLHLIKVNIAFPLYKKKYPDISSQEMEDIWNSNEKSPSRSSSSSSERSNPDLILRCPRCKSTNIVLEGFEGSTAICRMCAHNWQVSGTKELYAAKTSIQMPTIQAYIDSKGKEIDPEFPKIFYGRSAREAYLKKSIDELLTILKNYSRGWKVDVFSSFVKKTIFMWIKYMESLPSKKGMPQTDKRKALLAVFAYYANIITNRGLSWQRISEIFGVLTEDLDKVKNKEIQTFWLTPQGSVISAELFPLLAIRETPHIKKQEDDYLNELLSSIKKDDTRATRIGLQAFLAKLDNKSFKIPDGVRKGEVNKNLKIVEMWFDNNPSMLKKVRSMDE